MTPQRHRIRHALLLCPQSHTCNTHKSGKVWCMVTIKRCKSKMQSLLNAPIVQAEPVMLNWHFFAAALLNYATDQSHPSSIYRNEETMTWAWPQMILMPVQSLTLSTDLSWACHIQVSMSPCLPWLQQSMLPHQALYDHHFATRTEAALKEGHVPCCWILGMNVQEGREGATS